MFGCCLICFIVHIVNVNIQHKNINNLLTRAIRQNPRKNTKLFEVEYENCIVVFQLLCY